MDKLTIENIPQMFDYVGILFAEKRDELCAMDAVMGDGDLGLTMSKGYGALPAFLRDLTGEGDIGKMMLKGAMKMQNTVPSTMGTLMSSGIMEASKAFRGKTELVPADMVTYVTQFAIGIRKRGKCELGDRTILDSVDAGAKRAAALVESDASASFLDVLTAAVEGAEEGCEATKGMLPKFGKAAVHSAKAKGIVDQGALAGKYMLEGLKNYFADQQ
ncbi:Dak phosphatase [Olsenella uli DSM 7084]|uniref:Dak phosphatase n=1 Tax=Olsenella uli (strain ATCC 49627 / DSM 7084 / CCUG 31166 / CIP 109912 / JCM 12494 / LMG 11480 / NCIMB 702895 / VPI D76D-27C) TaxID=633147 RepID=E1QYR1_OLSUV|nr:dihydroxyacetone kinase subunit L [Olsenella uli]ADK67525.1 Dak phosphatase [Olsenella uli DSM 7084]